MNSIHRLMIGGGLIGVFFASAVLGVTDPCNAIAGANEATMQSKYKVTSNTTGLQLGPYMAKIHMHHKQQSCKFVREDSLNGEAVAIYTQHMVAPEGSTDEELWISKGSNRIVREEIDGEITGSGHGHLSMLFHY